MATGNPGEFKVTSTVAIPTEATGGSILVAIDGHPAIPADAPLDASTRIPVPNAVARTANLNADGRPRRPSRPTSATAVVDIAKCNDCHKNLSLHGNNRQGSLDVCTTCHNTEATDKRRPSEPGPGVDGKTQVPIDFKTMIHEIHTANIVVYGFGGSRQRLRRGHLPDAAVELPGLPRGHQHGVLRAAAPARTEPRPILGNTAAENLRTTTWFATCGSCHTRRRRPSPTCAASAAVRT